MNYCIAHQREATRTTERGDPICDPALGGLTIPCKIVSISATPVSDYWKIYVKQVYPNGMNIDQQRQVMQAFYAGGLAAFSALMKASHLPDDQAEQALSQLETDITSIVQAAKQPSQ